MSSYPKVWLIRLLCCALLLAGGMSVFAQNTPEEDNFLQLLRQELQLQYDSLRQTNCPPYSLTYRVKETTEHHLSANFGNIYDNSTTKTAILTIEIRVGTPESDNYHYLSYKTPYIKQIPLPLDENASLVRKILRNETRKAHQEALIQRIENKIDETLFDAEDEQENFLYIRNNKDAYYEPPILETHWNNDLLKQNLRHCTLPQQLHLTEKSADLLHQTIRRYLVDSKNNYFVENNSSTMLTLRVGDLTIDNVPESIERQYFAYYPHQLPDANVLGLEMSEMETLLSNVLDAEKCDFLHCPVLLSAKASSVLIHNLLGHDLENSTNSWLHYRIDQQIMPESFTLYSDPSAVGSKNHFFGGSYVFDDEGTINQHVIHIAHGEVQRQLLTTRTQQPNAFSSNGHARGNRNLPTARQSNLFLISNKTLTQDQLLNLLREETQRQKQAFALYVEDVEVRCDTQNIINIYPTVCYKIYSNSHNPDEMVRDVLLTGDKQQWLSNLMAAGEDVGSVAIMCHSQQDDLLTNGSAPALLFRSAEVQPLLKTPQPRVKRLLMDKSINSSMTTAEIFQRSAQQEWKTDVELLKIGEETAPYYEEFLMTEARFYTVEASEGGLLFSNEKPVRQFVPRLLLGSNLYNNENMAETETPPTSYPLPLENRSLFADDFRKAADAEYIKVLKQWNLKQILFPTINRSYPERSYAHATQTYDECTFDFPLLSHLEILAQETSATLAKHDFLIRSGVNIYVMMGNTYFWSSEKTTYSRPISIIGVQIFGAVDRDGNEYLDTKTFFLPCTDSLFSSPVIQNELDKLTLHLRKVQQFGEKQNDYYTGPVLLEGEAVGQILVSSLMESSPNLLVHRELLLAHPSHKLSFEGQLDKIITSKKITVTANKTGDEFDKSTFIRHEKTDAEGVETMETEIIRDGELISLMGNRNVTKSTPYSNGFQQLAICNEGCFATKGASRIDFEHKTSVSHKKLKQMLIKEAKKQGCQYAYIIRQVSDANMLNIIDKVSTHDVQVLQCYRVDVRTGKEIPIIDAKMPTPNFYLLENILYVSDKQAAFPVMMQVPGASGTRDFPFAGVPTCIVAPDGLLLKSAFLHP